MECTIGNLTTSGTYMVIYIRVTNGLNVPITYQYVSVQINRTIFRADPMRASSPL